jgi:ribosomal protein L15
MDIKLKTIKAPEEISNYKATTHFTGKIGFTKIAAENMKLNENKFIEFAENENDENDNNLYVFVRNEKKEGLLKVNKAGSYYHIIAKGLLEKLNIDYKSKRIMFDITELPYGNEIVYKFNRREKNRDKKTTK